MPGAERDSGGCAWRHVADEALLSAIAAGQREALAELFDRRQRNVYRFALHLTGSPSVADDVTQEVFIAVLADAARFERGRATVTAWLCGIARNFVRRRLSAERVAEPLDADEGWIETIPALTADPLEDLTSAEGIEALRKAILTLPLKYREPIVLCELEEMPYADAAAALACPVGTLKSRLNRGRTLLAAKLQAGRADHTAGSQAGLMKCIA